MHVYFHYLTFFFNASSIFKMLKHRGRRNRRVRKVFALHTTDLALSPNTSYATLSQAEMISDTRIRCNPKYQQACVPHNPPSPPLITPQKPIFELTQFNALLSLCMQKKSNPSLTSHNSKVNKIRDDLMARTYV